MKRTTAPPPPAVFDPWNATEEEAWAAQAALDATPPQERPPGVHMPVVQTAAAQHVAQLQARIDTCPGREVMWAMVMCTTAGLVAPRWLAEAFAWRYTRGLWMLGGWSEPESFGMPYPPNVKMDAERKHHFDRSLVWGVLHDFRRLHPGTPEMWLIECLKGGCGPRVGFDIDQELLDRVRRLNIVKSTFQDRKREAETMLGPVPKTPPNRRVNRLR